MQNLRSSREIKPKKLEDKLSIYNSRGSNYNSRNQSNNRNINNNINKKQKHNSASRGRSHKIIKEQNNNENKEKLLNKIEKKMNNHLLKYNISENEYNKKVINDIIYDEKKHIVSILKDYIFENSGNDFLQRFYYKHESINRLPKITGYYEKYTLFSPVYFNMEDIVKIMIKNVKKKKKYLEMIEENEDLEYNENEENFEFTHIINPSDISDNTLTFTINSYVNIQNDNNLNNLSELIHNIDNDEKYILFEKDSFFNVNNRIRNNSYEIVFNDLEISKSIFNSDEKIKKKSNKKNEIKHNERISETIINYKNISNKAKLPKKGKILEIKKLDLRNINNLDTINKKKDIEKEIKTKENISDRQKKSNYYSNNYLKTTKTAKNKISKVIKEKTTNMIIPQNLNNHLSTTRANASKHIICINNKLKSNENIVKIVKYPKKNQLSNRTNSNRFKTLIQKKKIPFEVHSSNKNIMNNSKRENSNSKNKNEIGNNIKTNKNKRHEILNNPLFTSPNIIIDKKNNINHLVSPIYNINLNLNLAKVNKNGNACKLTSIKKRVNTYSNQTGKNIINKNSNNNLNNQNKGNSLNPSSQNTNQYSYLQHKVSKIQFNLNNQKKTINSNNQKIKDEKISYDLKNNNNKKIGIHKQISINNNNNSTTNTNTNPPSITININSTNGNLTNEKKIIKKEDNKNKEIKTNKTNNNNNKGKRVILPRENKNNSKNTKRTKPKIKEIPNKSFELIKTIYKETSMSLGKLRKKLRIESYKKYPLTSRNEKDIPFNLFYKMLKNK